MTTQTTYEPMNLNLDSTAKIVKQHQWNAGLTQQVDLGDIYMFVVSSVQRLTVNFAIKNPNYGMGYEPHMLAEFSKERLIHAGGCDYTETTFVVNKFSSHGESITQAMDALTHAMEISARYINEINKQYA